MGKKGRVYKPGDYVFAKVKGYPAWPAKIESLNGKKYSIFFFGTGETGNLPANDLFDYFEHKQKFLEKVLKRRDYNEGLAQIESETVELGLTSNDKLEVTLDTTADQTVDTTTPIDTSTEVEPDQTVDTISDTPAVTPEVPKVSKKRSADTPTSNNQPPAKTRKTDETEIQDINKEINTINSVTPQEEVSQPENNEEPVVPAVEEEPTEAANAAETPVTTEEIVKTPSGRGRKPSNKLPPNSTPRTPRRAIKPEVMSPVYEPHVPVPESVSRSGRKIKPKRYLDEESAESQAPQTPVKRIKTLPLTPSTLFTAPAEEDEIIALEPTVPVTETAPVPASSANQPSAPTESANRRGRKKLNKQTSKIYNVIAQNELEKILESFTTEDESNSQLLKESVLPAVLPSGKVVGIKFSEETYESTSPEAKKQVTTTMIQNMLRIKRELEIGQTDVAAVANQIETEINLAQSEIVVLKKDRENEVKKRTLNLLKIEHKLLEIEKGIKASLTFKAADTDRCIRLLDELDELSLTKMMLLKHPKTVSFIKALKRYVGNGDNWKLTEEESEKFKENLPIINTKAHQCFDKIKQLFDVEEDSAFMDIYAQQQVVIKMVADSMNPSEFIELVDEPPELQKIPVFNTTEELKDKLKIKKETNQSSNKPKTESKNDTKASGKKSDAVGKSPRREKSVSTS